MLQCCNIRHMQFTKTCPTMQHALFATPTSPDIAYLAAMHIHSFVRHQSKLAQFNKITDVTQRNSRQYLYIQYVCNANYMI